jgi:enterochelin esterase-like enzyme
MSSVSTFEKELLISRADPSPIGSSTARRAARGRGPVVGENEIRFTLADPGRALTSVRLAHELPRPRLVDFTRAPRARSWTLDFPRPDADRMEYQLDVTHRNGRTQLVCDPGNPLRARGPFGEKSVLEFDGYRPPAWVDEDAPPGDLDTVEIRSRALRTVLEVPIWTATGGSAGEELPLLVVHDGPEYAAYSSLLEFLDAAWADGQVPTMRAALLPPPGDRNQSYSGSAVYARALAHELLPALTEAAPAPGDRAAPVGMGASLGALAMLHVHRLYPQSFGGLFLQSGSFFRQRSDRQEAGFVRFHRITRVVGQILTGDGWIAPIPVRITCGTVEENLANNRAVARALREQGYDVDLREVRDAHNWIAWRDAFDPTLSELLRQVWS